MQKINKNKETKIVGEEALEIKKFIIIFVITILILGLIALGTSLLVNNREKVNDEENYPGEVQYTNISVGMILNRPYKEYYVMVYNFEDNDAGYYSTLIGNYISLDKAKKVYICDLSNTLNRKYIAKDGKSNPKAKSSEEFKFGKATLLKIKDGKIESYLEKDSEIGKILH